MIDQPIEGASFDELRALQLQRLKGVLSRAYERVAHYKEVFDAAGVRPADVKTRDDLAHFPFTTKEDLRREYPLRMLAVPTNQAERIHAPRGPTGKPPVVEYTKA